MSTKNEGENENTSNQDSGTGNDNIMEFPDSASTSTSSGESVQVDTTKQAKINQEKQAELEKKLAEKEAELKKVQAEADKHKDDIAPGIRKTYDFKGSYRNAYLSGKYEELKKQEAAKAQVNK